MNKSELIKAISHRHVVRKYLKREVGVEIKEQLLKRIKELNHDYHQKIKLVLNQSDGLNLFGRMILGKNANNYLVLAGDDSEKLGYCGADLMLYLQALGLNSWFVGSTFNKAKLEAKDGSVSGIIIFGYGKDDGCLHKMKAFNQVNHAKNYPSWYEKGVKAALKAPTALNKQNFYFDYDKEQVELGVKKSPYAQVEAGILTYFFELVTDKSIAKVRFI